MNWHRQVQWRSMGKWWIVGLAFYGGGLGILYVFREIFGLPLMVTTILAVEITTLLRFLINDRWVFGHRRPTWRRLWQYHVAGASGSAIWWVVTNALPRFGVHYLLAATIGTGCSVGVSMLTNFLWIWRRKPVPSVAASPGRVESESAD